LHKHVAARNDEKDEGHFGKERETLCAWQGSELGSCNGSRLRIRILDGVLATRQAFDRCAAERFVRA